MRNRVVFSGLGLLGFFIAVIIFMKPYAVMKKTGTEEKKAKGKTEEVNEGKKLQEVTNWQQMLRQGWSEKTVEQLSWNLEKARLSGSDGEILLRLKEMGLYYLLTGSYDEARIFFKKALEIAEANDWPLKGAMMKKHIAHCHYRMFRFQTALELLYDVQEVFEEYKLDEYRALNLLIIAKLHEGLFDYDRSLHYLEEGLAIYKKLAIPENLILFYRDMGDLHSRFGYTEKAVKCFQEGLEIARTSKHVEMVALLLRDIGYTYQMSENFKEAAKYLGLAEEAFKIAKGVEEYYPHEVARLHFFKVEHFLETGDYSEALDYLENFNWDIYGAMSDFHNYYRQLGEALKGLGKEKKAGEAFLKSVSFVEEKRWEPIDDVKLFFDKRRGGGKLEPYLQLISLLAERYLKGERHDEKFLEYGKDIASSAFYFSESVKARALLDTIAARAKTYSNPSISPELRKKETQLLGRFNAAEKNLQAVLTMGKDIYLRVKKQKDKVYEELQTFINELRKTHPLYAFINYPLPSRAEALPLADQEVLIEYVLLDHALYIFLVRKGQPIKVFKVPGKAETLVKQLENFCRPLIRDPVTGDLPYNKFSVDKGKELYDKLLAKVLVHVQEGEDLLIVPDGVLAMLPFEILVIEPGKTLSDTVFVADRWDISYYQSASIMALNRMVKRPAPPKQLFALGNPVYNENDPRYTAFKRGRFRRLSPGNKDLDKFSFKGPATRREWGAASQSDSNPAEITFAPLPESETEVKAIARVLRVRARAPDVLLNIDANETQFREAPLKDYRYLHFATHADLPGDVQGIEEPFILLGQVENREPDDGFLILSEVANLELNAEMVVLSACVTGLGTVRRGEGVANFAYAFHCAGVKSVVVSLWEVASRQAVEFMTTFYSQLKKGETRARALAFARNRIRKRYPNPFFWAPFILYGERK